MLFSKRETKEFLRAINQTFDCLEYLELKKKKRKTPKVLKRIIELYKKIT